MNVYFNVYLICDTIINYFTTTTTTTYQFNPWQVVPRQVFTPYSHLLISTAFVVVSLLGFLWVTVCIFLDVILHCREAPWSSG